MSGRLRRIACWWTGAHDLRTVYHLKAWTDPQYIREDRCAKCGRQLALVEVDRLPSRDEAGV